MKGGRTFLRESAIGFHTMKEKIDERRERSAPGSEW
jgi:hypothetical protein